MAAYKVDQTACADKLWFQVFSSTRVEADLQRFLYSDLVMLLPRATSRAEDLDAVYPRWRL
jgi:hypothetical protein